MEKRRKRAGTLSYDRRRMALQHPIDTEIRERLRRQAPNQIDLGKRIGRSQGWVNKYLNGVGHATIDDVIRIAALLIGRRSAATDRDGAPAAPRVAPPARRPPAGRTRLSREGCWPAAYRIRRPSGANNSGDKAQSAWYTVSREGTSKGMRTSPFGMKPIKRQHPGAEGIRG